MENSVFFKKYLLANLIVSIFIFLLFFLVDSYEYSKIQFVTNKKIGTVLALVKERYPEIEENELIDILESKDKYADFLREYGYDLEKDSYIQLENIKRETSFVKVVIVSFLVCASLMVLVFYNRKVEREVRKLITLVDKINHRNYELGWQNYNEDELSILRSEIYKTTVMLKETAENSLKDKAQLKNSLSDISHQIKTPLTSIIIMLDAIIDDEEMEKSVRIGFINNIKREIMNINFLVQSLLKLSKFDAETINFIESKVEIGSIADEAIKNVAALCDLKDVTIEREGEFSEKILVDFAWQVEAVTNILKNCVEYSDVGGVITMSTSSNNVYVSLSIKDRGRGIAKEDIPHIFERFYKGKNSSKDSVGIGLALAKSIIEKSGGSISVDSVLNEGSVFTIKYFRKK